MGTVVCLGLKVRINVVLASWPSEAKYTLHSRFTNTLPEWQDLCSGAGGLQNLTHVPFPASTPSLAAPPPRAAATQPRVVGQHTRLPNAPTVPRCVPGHVSRLPEPGDA